MNAYLRSCSAIVSALVVLSINFRASDAVASAFTFGDLVVVQVGDGLAGLNANATAAFLKEFTVGGSLLQTIPLPTAVSGPNQPLTLSGSATSEGFLTLSLDKQYLTMGGYGAVP